MLIRAVIKNYYSIGEELEFNLLPEPYKKTHPDHIYQDKRVRLLKASAIYGANGAGKSNFISSLRLLKDIVSGAFEIPDKTTLIENRLLSGFRQEPVHLEVEFSYLGYYLAYVLEFKDGVIVSESLYELGFEKEDVLVYERGYDSRTEKIWITPGDKFFTSAKEKMLLSLLTDNLLSPKKPVLTMAEVLKNELVSAAKEWFDKGLEVVFPMTKFTTLVPSLTDEEFNGFANDVLKSFDTGISKLDVRILPLEQSGLSLQVVNRIRERLESSPETKLIVAEDGTLAERRDGKDIVLKPQTHHLDDQGHDVSFDLFDESDGSQRLIQYIPVLRSLMTEEKTIFIDEIERSIHPSLLKALITKILSEGDRLKGQIVFTTHECNLLDMNILRPDEIWFVEKSDSGSTSMYPLTDFDVRQDLDIEKGYLRGRFGAIPFIGNLRDLRWK